MKPIRLFCYHVALPLRKPIKHASHTRETSDSVVVRIEFDQGSIGWGEGVPRTYVTGETVDTAMDSICAYDLGAAFGNPDRFEDAVASIRQFNLPSIEADVRGMFGNAARSAIELALLDGVTRAFDKSLGEAIRLDPGPRLPVRNSPKAVRYSGAITSEKAGKETRSAWKMKLYGFKQVKLKVGVTGQNDIDRMRRVRKILGPRVDLRLDANESWPLRELEERVEAVLPFQPSVIEQPIRHEEVSALGEIRPRLRVPIMLDESLCGIPDGRRAIAEGLTDFFNLRISKCGGLFPTLQLIQMASSQGLGVQLGCHPGESGLLSAAGRHLASNVDNIQYLEGSYDRYVLKENITAKNVNFRYGGRAMPISGAGLGVSVDVERLRRLTITSKEVTYD